MERREDKNEKGEEKIGMRREEGGLAYHGSESCFM